MGARAMHMVPEARYAVNHLAVLPMWYSRLATITSPKGLDLALTSHCTHYRTSNFPTNDTNCRVHFWEVPYSYANSPKPNGPDTINLVEKMGSRTGL